MRRGRRMGRGGLLWGLLALCFMFVWIRRSRAVAQAATRGLHLCAQTMIPSLFPFMVLCELVVRSGVGERMSRLLARLLRPVFGVSEGGTCALIMGALCGFPMGARVAAAYYRAGRMSERELGRVICFCNVPSTAFLVSAVGGSLLGSTRVGWWLTGVTLGAAALTGFLFRPADRGSGKALPHIGDTDTPQGKGVLLTEAVAGAASGMLQVCATVVLFCTLVGTLTEYARALALPQAVRTLLFGAVELSTGVCEAATLTDRTLAVTLCAAIAGWGGLSVHCQILAVCDGCPVPLGRFWLSRLLQGVLCGGATYLALKCGVPSLEATLDLPGQGQVWQVGAYLAAGSSPAANIWALIWTSVLLGGLAVLLGRTVKGRLNGKRRT